MNVANSVLRMLYFAFVHSQLLYGIEVYGNISKNNINQLIILNNKILRIVDNKPLQYRVMNLYKNYNTIPLPELHYYQLLCLVHKYHYRNDKVPVIFSNYFSSNKDIHHHHTKSSSLLHLFGISTSVGTKSAKFKASQLWNTLPEKSRIIILLKTNCSII